MRRLMVYLFVLLGSFALLSGWLGLQIVFRNRAVRAFVRSMQTRSLAAEEKGLLLDENVSRKPSLSPRFSSKEMQELRTILRSVDYAMRKDNLPEVERLYIQALTIRPDAYDVQAELAKLYLKTGREPKAEALYRDILEYNNDPSCFANLGLAYYQQKKFDLSCEAYLKALAEDPQNPERAFNVGRAYMALGNFTEAINYLEKAAVKLWRNTELLQMLANCYEAMGYHEELLETYKKINRIEPYNRDIRTKIEVLSV